eukprot:7235776-Prymnesium_polylepis.1
MSPGAVAVCRPRSAPTRPRVRHGTSSTCMAYDDDEEEEEEKKKKLSGPAARQVSSQLTAPNPPACTA